MEMWACAHFSPFSFWRQPRRFFLTSKTANNAQRTTHTHHTTQNKHKTTMSLDRCAILCLQANQAIYTTIITSVTAVSDCASILLNDPMKSFQLMSKSAPHRRSFYLAPTTQHLMNKPNKQQLHHYGGFQNIPRQPLIGILQEREDEYEYIICSSAFSLCGVSNKYSGAT